MKALKPSFPLLASFALMIALAPAAMAAESAKSVALLNWDKPSETADPKPAAVIQRVVQGLKPANILSFGDAENETFQLVLKTEEDAHLLKKALLEKGAPSFGLVANWKGRTMGAKRSRPASEAGILDPRTGKIQNLEDFLAPLRAKRIRDRQLNNDVYYFADAVQLFLDRFNQAGMQSKKNRPSRALAGVAANAHLEDSKVSQRLNSRKSDSEDTPSRLDRRPAIYSNSHVE